MTRQWRRSTGLALISALMAGTPAVVQAAWEPTKPIEFAIPAGTGGGADQIDPCLASGVRRERVCVLGQPPGCSSPGAAHRTRD